MILDAGPYARPRGHIDAWLLTDEQAELAAAIRRRARELGVLARVAAFHAGDLRIEPKPLVHTNHPTFGYEIRRGDLKVVWAPEFFEFPRWARSSDLMFAEASSWDRPIYFRGAVGGHLAGRAVQRAAQRAHVKRLVCAHIGRPTLRAIERGLRPSFGEFARDGQIFLLRAHSGRRS